MNTFFRSFILCVVLSPGLVMANSSITKPSDSRALAGLEQGKILWDITLAQPDALIARLNVLEETYHDMVRQNLTPNMMFTFRGGAVQHLAQDLSQRDLDQAAASLAVQQKLSELLALPGIHMEACQIATRRFNLTRQEDLMQGVTLVGNTFLSIMGYENQGYTTIRID
ncbi:hypothetical protein THIAE_08875 [Thiomicrospira aerophila AL3]|uniref:DsrE family protein n=1 Tax=Thiomicrospira aerophila AL3 TaxID=717772 RepID=W0DTT0_9GAMM|nr:hypothetical protein [Thiomicrospira aerophila]AHF01852.1 hypothetical protein THIAE_08875 [Thiomicrospira aerophila AL3]